MNYIVSLRVITKNPDGGKTGRAIFCSPQKVFFLLFFESYFGLKPRGSGEVPQTKMFPIRQRDFPPASTEHFTVSPRPFWKDTESQSRVLCGEPCSSSAPPPGGMKNYNAKRAVRPHLHKCHWTIWAEVEEENKSQKSPTNQRSKQVSRYLQILQTRVSWF